MKRIARIVVVALAGLLALTGCSWSKAAVAAEVDGTVIAVADLNPTKTVIEEEYEKQKVPISQSESTQLALIYGIYATVIEKAEAAGTVTVPSGSWETSTNPALTRLNRTFAILNTTDQTLMAQLITAFNQAKVMINPRFGLVWYPQSGTTRVFLADGGSLSQLAPVG